MSLIMPSIDMAEDIHIIKWLPATIGLILGVLFLIFIYYLSDKLKKKDMNMLLFSVTLHNIPEGMAVGVCFAGFLSASSPVSLAEAMILALGIAIQNIPEGAIISMPLKLEGESKFKS